MTPSTDSTAARLVDAARELIDEGGPAAVTLREVGARAGVSRTTPYRHFADKRHLLSAVGVAEQEDLATEMRAALARHPRSERARLRAVLTTYVTRALAHPRRHALANGAWAQDGPEAAVHAAAATVKALAFAEVLRAQEAGVLPAGDPVRLTTLAHATIRGAVDLHLAGHLSRHGTGTVTPADVVDDLLALLTGTRR